MSNIDRAVAPNGDDYKLQKKINEDKDVIHFKNKSPAYQDISYYVELLCERIQGTSNKVLNHKYVIQNEVFQTCCLLFDKLTLLCDETDLNNSKGAATSRFGHVAFRDWYDGMKHLCRDFVDHNLSPNNYPQLREELYTYLIDSFGNRSRIDYGTGHELSFLIFTMGLIHLVNLDDGDEVKSSNTLKELTKNRLKLYVGKLGWDIHSIFAHKYLRLCRKVQIKFRLEPAGSRGVFNMDDFQFMPFLFGTAQLSGIKYIPTRDFYTPDQVDMFKSDFILFEAVNFILENKRGPFFEHSHTLYCFSELATWDNIYRRVKMKFKDDILGPFPIIQHLLFGKHILRWSND